MNRLRLMALRRAERREAALAHSQFLRAWAWPVVAEVVPPGTADLDDDVIDAEVIGEPTY